MANILLVEDNPHNQAIFQAALRKSGHALRLAQDGNEALAMVRQDPPDLILLDLSLPQVDGWTVARTIRADANAKISTVPIVALTAHAMKGDRERALDAGCNDYLSKPVSPRELVRRVAALLPSAA